MNSTSRNRTPIDYVNEENGVENASIHSRLTWLLSKYISSVCVVRDWIGIAFDWRQTHGNNLTLPHPRLKTKPTNDNTIDSLPLTTRRLTRNDVSIYFSRLLLLLLLFRLEFLFSRRITFFYRERRRLMLSNHASTCHGSMMKVFYFFSLPNRFLRCCYCCKMIFFLLSFDFSFFFFVLSNGAVTDLPLPPSLSLMTR